MSVCACGLGEEEVCWVKSQYFCGVVLMERSRLNGGEKFT